MTAHTHTLVLVDRARLINEEVHAAAKHLARRGLTGAIGDPLPDAMSGAACARINDNQQWFRGLVREYGK